MLKRVDGTANPAYMSPILTDMKAGFERDSSGSVA
jgi:hypothetical protein